LIWLDKCGDIAAISGTFAEFAGDVSGLGGDQPVTAGSGKNSSGAARLANAKRARRAPADFW
jgi:hypothetical protein